MSGFTSGLVAAIAMSAVSALAVYVPSPVDPCTGPAVERTIEAHPRLRVMVELHSIEHDLLFNQYQLGQNRVVSNIGGDINGRLDGLASNSAAYTQAVVALGNKQAESFEAACRAAVK